MPDQFDPPLSITPAGSRFEHFYCPEWRAWVVIDRADGTLTKCADQGVAVERAAMLEGIHRIIFSTAAGHN